MSLTDTEIRQLKPGQKQRKYFDADGLYLLVMPTGSKLWRLKYYYGGKEKLMSLGKYPAVGLRAARLLREEVKTLIAQGKNPQEGRKAQKQAASVKAHAEELTFKAVALEWIEHKTGTLTDVTIRKNLRRMEKYLFPFLGSMPVAELKPADILQPLRTVESKGHYDLAHSLLGVANGVCKYARACGYAEFNPAADLSSVLKPCPPVKHRATIVEPAEIGRLLRAIDAYPGSISVRYALKIMPYVFTRSKELRLATWQELDLEKAVWTIPAERMKAKREHIVPLPRQAVELFRELHAYNGSKPYVFASHLTRPIHISGQALRKALRKMGFGNDDMTIHGFRSMFSTLCNEKGIDADVIERSLAHAPKNAVRAAYNHAEYMEKRRVLLQDWADYLDNLR